MKRLYIDFAPRSTASVLARIRPIALLIAASAIALGITAAARLIDLTRQQEAIGIELKRAQRDLVGNAQRKQPPPKPPIPEQQAAAVNHAVAQLNLPWRDLFDAVEASTPSTIALLAIEPDAKKHVLKGAAEAKTSDAMIAYIEELKRQPFFSLVELTKHEINVQDPNKPIRFQFEAEWSQTR